MAFVGMMIVFLILFIMILGAFALFGIIILSVGLVKGKKANARGRKYPCIMVILGALAVSVPVSIVGNAILFATASAIDVSIDRLSYRNCVDKWKNEWVSTETVKEDIMTEFMAAAEAGDKAAIIALYSAEIRKDSELENQVEEFLKEYPKGLYWKPGSGTGSSSSSSDHGESVANMDIDVVLYKGDERYYVSFGVCYENDYNKDKVGLEYFRLKSEKAEVLEYEDEFMGYSDNDYAFARINLDVDYETRLVWGHPCKFYPMDRTITQQQVLDALKQTGNIYELMKILGEPNGTKEIMNDIIYEIQSDNGEPRYIVISHDEHGKIYFNSTYFTGTDQQNAQWLDSNGNIKE